MTKVLIKNIQRKKAFTVSCLLLVIVLLNRSSLAESSPLLIHETHDETFQKGLPSFVELQNKKQLLTKSGLMMKKLILSVHCIISATDVYVAH